MFIKKEDAIEGESSQHCKFLDYEFPTERLSYTTLLINGRHPERGKVVNTECEEIFVVLSGSGVLHSSQGVFELKQGDAYHVQVNDPCWVEGKELKLGVVNAPKWHALQRKIVE